LSLHSQTNLSYLKAIPITNARLVRLENHRCGGQFAKSSRGRSVGGARRKFFFFAGNEFTNLWFCGTKTELAIEPESAGLNSFFVFVTNLIGIKSKRRDPQQMTKLY